MLEIVIYPIDMFSKIWYNVSIGTRRYVTLSLVYIKPIDNWSRLLIGSTKFLVISPYDMWSWYISLIHSSTHE